VEAGRLLWELSHALRTGVVVVDFGAVGRARVEIVRGWVHAVDLAEVARLFATGPAPFRIGPRGEDRLTLLLRREGVAGAGAAAWTFDDKLPLTRDGAVSPFHPAAVIRNLISPRLPDETSWRARAGNGRLTLATPPHASCLGLDEKPLVSYLSKPRTLAEIDAASLCPPRRAARLLAFLDAMGALALDGKLHDLLTLADAYARLELPDGAPEEAIKRAYRRLARSLHPDLHPGASADEHRELERRFAEVSAAYRRLM
jgi:hypothetical protein